jgi:thioredoxin reductase
MDTYIFDVIIIGGSYAGLSAAMALGRSLRSTLIIDSGTPCNRQTPHSHNFLTRDGIAPAELAAIAREQVGKYSTVQFVEDLVLTGSKENDFFIIFTASGKEYRGKKLIIATGIKDQMPDIEGFAECWGISVVHCPYCHGYEYHRQKTGLIADSEIAFHLVPMLKNLTHDLTLFTNGKAMITSDQREKLERNNIPVIEKEIARIEHEKGYLENVILSDGTRRPLKALYARLPFTQHTDIPESLGCEITEQGYIRIDMMQKTSVPGIFACGDNTTGLRSVANAVSAGNFTGAVVNKELAEEEFV